MTADTRTAAANAHAVKERLETAAVLSPSRLRRPAAAALLRILTTAAAVLRILTPAALTAAVHVITIQLRDSICLTAAAGNPF